MKRWTEDEIKYAKELIENGDNYKEISKKLNRTLRAVQKKLEGYYTKYKIPLLYDEIICKTCGEKFKALKTEKRVFCSLKCQLQNIIDDKKIDSKKIKKHKCIDCNCDIEIKNNTNYSTARCEKCKNNHNEKSCKYCGEKLYYREICDDCKPHTKKLFLFKKLNTFENNTKLSILNTKSVDYLSEMYYDKKYSRQQISEILNIDKKSLYNFFITNNFKLRDLSESLFNAFYQGRLEINKGKTKYKSGWHKTWNGNNVYCRSSYETDYCHILDENKIEYSMETKKIKYWDSTLKKERIAVPDFYLPETNELVEIKSNWTYDEQNMNDKIKAYKDSGYKIKLILEHEEYIIN